MIHVIASIFVKDGHLADVLRIYESYVPQVRKRDDVKGLVEKVSINVIENALEMDG